MAHNNKKTFKVNKKGSDGGDAQSWPPHMYEPTTAQGVPQLTQVSTRCGTCGTSSVEPAKPGKAFYAFKCRTCNTMNKVEFNSMDVFTSAGWN